VDLRKAAMTMGQRVAYMLKGSAGL
jgi:hypothetical protein